MLIRKLLAERRVATQGALRALLGRAGHHVTQGTLSRDLAAIGARRAPLPGGVAPDLVLLVVVALALSSGPMPGLITGFCAGLALDIAPPVPSSVTAHIRLTPYLR